MFGLSMNYNATVFVNQFPVVRNFVQHLAYYRSSKAEYDAIRMQSPFWGASISAHLKVSAVEWCKVFGSDGCNATHWKNLGTSNRASMKASFRQRLRSAGYSQKAWSDYHKAMIDFRNKYVAHKEIGFSQPVPSFDIALNVAYVYDEWMRDVIKPDIYAGKSLRQEYADFVKSSRPIVSAAMGATLGMKE